MSDYIIASDGELYHYGVKGMKWGVRRKARKDAKEYARAKMFYGEGAGNRRKLIKATVNERSKDPEYKREFDKALSKQDMAKHASKAKTERKVKDVEKTAAKTGRGVVNMVTGHPERLGAAMAGVAMVYTAAHRAGVDKTVSKMAKQKVSSVYNSARTAYGKYKVNQLLKRKPPKM